jgi:RimJ/RimL family protein N-acetyltransferase
MPMSSSHPVQNVTPLRQGRVRFTPLDMDNIHTHFRWNNDPELNRLDSEMPHEKEPFGAFKQRFEKLCDHPSPKHRDFEIHDDENDVLIGVAYASRVSEHNHNALVGITIGDRDYWGQGYGRESLRLLLAYCFEEMELHRVSTETFEYNTAWKDLVEGMGFVKEGTAREYLYRDGRYWNKHNYALLAHEYRSQKAERRGDGEASGEPVL